jgi:hypothetical protein
MAVAYSEFEMCSFRLLSICITLENHEHNAYNACYETKMSYHMRLLNLISLQ